MRTAVRLAFLLLLGLALTYFGVRIIGWFAALTWDREVYRQVASQPLIFFLTFSIGMAALPVALLSGFAGALAARFVPTPPSLAAAVMTVPWAFIILSPPPGTSDAHTWLFQMFSAHTAGVLLAVPLGSAVGLAIARSGRHPGAA